MTFETQCNPNLAPEPYFWLLVTAAGERRAKSPGRFTSREAARKDIAAFRKQAGGIKFAKVVDK